MELIPRDKLTAITVEEVNKQRIASDINTNILGAYFDDYDDAILRYHNPSEEFLDYVKSLLTAGGYNYECKTAYQNHVRIRVEESRNWEIFTFPLAKNDWLHNGKGG